MSVNAHDRAEALMAEADRLVAAGRGDDAAQYYRLAAESEEEAFRHIPDSRPKTRGIIAVSAVALYRQAGVIDEAIRLAHQHLAGRGVSALPDFAQSQLRELLDEARQELQARAEARTRPSRVRYLPSR